MDIDTYGENIYNDNVAMIIATNIFAAAHISKNIKKEYLNLPKRGSWLAGYALPFTIDKLLTQEIDKIEVGNFPFDYREERINGRYFPYVEYFSSDFRFHVKKSNCEHKLPEIRKFRLSNAQTNRIALDFGDEYIDNSLTQGYGIITYNHKGFDLRYIIAGIPEYDYSGWAYKKDIMKNISKELANEIEKKNSVKLKEEFEEEIVKKQYGLRLKGI